MGRKPKNGQTENITLPTITKQEEPHLQILSKHKHIFDLFVKTGEIVGLYPHIKSEIVQAYRVYDHTYKFNERCNACVGEMLTTVYRYYDSAK